MLALALASVVLGVVLSLMQMLVVVDKRGLVRFEQTTDAAIAHRAIGRVMQNLVAAPSLTEAPPAPLPAHEGEAEAMVEQALLEGAAQAQGESALSEAAEDMERTDRARIEMFFEEWDDGVQLPRLEVVTTAPPTSPVDDPLLDDAYDRAYAEALGLSLEEAQEAALRKRFTAMYRGVFEVRPVVNDAGIPVEWVLQYSPIDPPSRPVVLVRDVHALFWQALPSASMGAEWSDVWVAWEKKDYPIAVRLAVALGDGTTIDWVFETSVSVGGP